MTTPMTSSTLLLLHGLGATPGVWAGTIAAVDWDGPVLIPALPGHGSAPWSGDYTLDALASAVAAEIGPETGPVVVIGHSLGGAVGLRLASAAHPIDVRAVLGLGIKTTWTDDDVAGMAKVAERGIRWFETRDEAVARFLRQAGLDGVADPDHPAVDDAVTDSAVAGSSAPAGTDADGGAEQGWRVAQDPMTFAQLPLDMAALVAEAEATGCRVVLGAGEHDQMATEAELAAFTAQPRIAAGRGHNVQVEDPGWVSALLKELAADL